MSMRQSLWFGKFTKGFVEATSEHKHWPKMPFIKAFIGRPEEGCSKHGPQIRQVPKILKHSEAPSIEPHNTNIPDIIRRMGDRSHRALPAEKGGCRYAIVAVDYFSKWVEVELFKQNNSL